MELNSDCQLLLRFDCKLNLTVLVPSLDCDAPVILNRIIIVI